MKILPGITGLAGWLEPERVYSLVAQKCILIESQTSLVVYRIKIPG